mmetsp:Transcript_60685/g.135277  ORF Transcript_60685/g.135277 Transcript_60685/m.135277 type:complete len:202 (-) Transcript_60685:39-644(-)
MPRPTMALPTMASGSLRRLQQHRGPPRANRTTTALAISPHRRRHRLQRTTKTTALATLEAAAATTMASTLLRRRARGKETTILTRLPQRTPRPKQQRRRRSRSPALHLPRRLRPQEWQCCLLRRCWGAQPRCARPLRTSCRRGCRAWLRSLPSAASRSRCSSCWLRRRRTPPRPPGTRACGYQTRAERAGLGRGPILRMGC